jgi:hypothetical protein
MAILRQPACRALRVTSRANDDQDDACCGGAVWLNLLPPPHARASSLALITNNLERSANFSGL